MLYVKQSEAKFRGFWCWNMEFRADLIWQGFLGWGQCLYYIFRELNYFVYYSNVRSKFWTF